MNDTPATPPVDEHTANDWLAERLNDTGRTAPLPPSTPMPTQHRGDNHRGKAEESRRGSHQ